MPTQPLLIVDADVVLRTSLKLFLENYNYKVCEAENLEEVAKQDLSGYSAIVCDDQQIDLIRMTADVPVIVTSSQASLRSAVIAMKLGAADYLAKPFDFEELNSIIIDLTRHRDTYKHIKIMGNSQEVKTLIDNIDRVAPTNTNVLIEGESGTGKELVARKIHCLSERADRQMVSLNCAAIPSALIESELFGTEGDSNNRANNNKVGLIEAADGSTLFLDEIGELSLDAQARLLRVLQEGEIRRIGAIETRKVSIRLIASTHRDLQKLVNEGDFRPDLYFRLNVMKFNLAPLRERGDDVILMAKHFLIDNVQKHGKTKLKFGETALSAMKKHNWPGNVRELKNAVERAVILCDKKTITAELLALETKARTNISFKTGDSAVSLKNYFMNFVIENQNQMTETQIAKKLGISRKALWQRRQKLGMPRGRRKTS